MTLAAALTPARFDAAWRRVRRRKGPGLDGVTPAAYARGLDRRLRRLRARVIDGRYRPGRLLRLTRRKPSGGLRTLGVPTLEDALVQTAVHLAIAPGLDAGLRPEVHGYRRGRSPATAIAHLLRATGARPSIGHRRREHGGWWLQRKN